jgi:hypothetical protein
MSVLTPTLPDSGRSPITGALVGALVGVVLGFAADVVVWLWAFGQALSGRAGIDVPFIVATGVEHGDVVVSSGPGVLLAPAVLAVVGLLVGLSLRRRGQVHADRDTAGG